jgi:hypothetical protein
MSKKPKINVFMVLSELQYISHIQRLHDWTAAYLEALHEELPVPAMIERAEIDYDQVSKNAADIQDFIRGVTDSRGDKHQMTMAQVQAIMARRVHLLKLVYEFDAQMQEVLRIIEDLKNKGELAL